jgi:hypothetical protein
MDDSLELRCFVVRLVKAQSLDQKYLEMSRSKSRCFEKA